MSKKQKSSYSELLQDPRWQKKRVEVLLRDEFRCQHCGNNEETLHVHHLRYEKGKMPWEYDNSGLITLCHRCHEAESKSNAEMYDSYKDLRDLWSKKGLSMECLNQLLEHLIMGLDTMDESCQEIESDHFKGLLNDSLFASMNYKDFEELLKYGVELGDYVKVFFPEMVDKYYKIKGELGYE